MTAAFTYAPSQDDIYLALRGFLQAILPPESDTEGFVVVEGQDNRVSEPNPDSGNFIIFTPLRMPRLSTNFEQLLAGGLTQSMTQALQVVFQIDVYGPQAFNNANLISTVCRSGYAVDIFSTINAAIAPLYADDPRQAQFVDGETQYEDRYIVEANLQVNFTATTAAQSANGLDLGLVDVDTDPSSWPNSVITVPN